MISIRAEVLPADRLSGYAFAESAARRLRPVKQLQLSIYLLRILMAMAWSSRSQKYQVDLLNSENIAESHQSYALVNHGGIGGLYDAHTLIHVATSKGRSRVLLAVA